MKPHDRRAPPHPHPATGIPVDASGGATVDPTKNVLDLVTAATLRIDDLAELRQELADTNNAHVKELAALRADHQRMMDSAESARIDSIRQVDLTNTANAATQALTAIQTLATTQAASAETLRAQVANTATQVQATLNGVTADFNKRIASLEQSSYEGAGKQKVADPASERTAMLVERLVAAQATDTGKGAGINLAWIGLLGVVSLLVGLLAIGTFVFITTRTPAAAPPIYVPAPYGTVLPSTPPGQTPR
jgi:hypothetical protein